MASAEVLTEIGNGQQQRRKVAQTYGRKTRRLPQIQRVQQNIFGHDDSDIENQLARLTIQTSVTEGTPPCTPKPCIGESRDNPDHKSQLSPNPTSESKFSARSEPEQQNEHSTLDRLLSLAGSDDIEPFAVFASKLSKHFDIEKIGEGSFAEVFKITSLSSISFPSKQQEHPIFHATGHRSGVLSSPQNYTSIIKIIPLADLDTPANILDRCSSVDSVSHEINILKQLDPVHGFTRFRGLRLVKGLWPDSFLQAYRDFRKRHRKRAINAPPDQDFDSEQIYALVEMDDAGSEISLIKRPSVFQVWDIFWISTILLANAEECIEFEHRDLHMSNICVKAARQQNDAQKLREDQGQSFQDATALPTSSTADGSGQLEFNLDIDPATLLQMACPPDSKIGLSNLRVTVIDYTVARACLSTEDIELSPSKPSKSKFVSARKSISSVRSNYNASDIIFDPMIFTSDPFASNLSDIESHLQNLTYKKTRAIAILNETNSTLSNSRDRNYEGQLKHNKWRAFIPQTNVVWLGYLLRVLIHRARGRTGKLHLLKGKVGKGGNSKMIKQLQEQMWATLLEMSKLINGDDYQDIEDQAGLSTKNEDKTENNPNNAEHEMEEPTWTDHELEKLPDSSLAILELAVQKGWVTADDIQAFRAVLENESS